MASELENIRFAIAVQREVVRIEKEKEFEKTRKALQSEGNGWTEEYTMRRKEEEHQRDVVWNEERRLRELEEKEKECLRRKRN